MIVFETRGTTITNLVKAVARIPGLEWLAEMDLDSVAPDEYFFDEGRPDASLPCRLYAVVTNQRAMDRVLSLWKNWIKNPSQRASSGFGPFKTLFQNLSDVRRWGPQDRIEESQIIADWQSSLVERADERIRFEAELWCRASENGRNQAYATFQALVAAQGGTCLAQAAISGINYHGVLVEMPADAVRQILSQIDEGEYNDLLRCEGVMFFRPLGQAGFIAYPVSKSYPSVDDRFASAPLTQGEPVVAMLDGLPLEHHVALADRLLIDDPDGFSSRYQATHQVHGTSMASLIVHGDLGETAAALESPVYVRPILSPTQDFLGASRKMFHRIPWLST